MATQITQTDSDGRVAYRVEGEMLREDALLLERLISEIGPETSIIVDLADLDFLDSNAAEVLRRLESKGVTIEGTEIFVQSSIDLAERMAS